MIIEMTFLIPQPAEVRRLLHQLKFEMKTAGNKFSDRKCKHLSRCMCGNIGRRRKGEHS